jgi:hypothetical protein
MTHLPKAWTFGAEAAAAQFKAHLLVCTAVSRVAFAVLANGVFFDMSNQSHCSRRRSLIFPSSTPISSGFNPIFLPIPQLCFLLFSMVCSAALVWLKRGRRARV